MHICQRKKLNTTMKVNEMKKSAGTKGKEISSHDEEENAITQITKPKVF